MKASVELFSSFPLSALTRALAFTCFYLVALDPALAQDIPRLPDGRPDFNGIWQVINEANWDLEPHIARHSVMMREGPINPVPAAETLEAGAVLSVPGSMGVIVGGGKIPYNEQARRVKESNAANWVTRDPEVKCYMPGVPRATYMPHPFQIVQSEKDFYISVSYTHLTLPTKRIV